MQKPYLRPYFYDEKPFRSEPNNLYLKEEVDLMSEAILALIEHATVQRKNLPTDQWENCWLPYSRERWKKSTELRRFFPQTAIGIRTTWPALLAASIWINEYSGSIPPSHGRPGTGRDPAIHYQSGCQRHLAL
jgi:hypothetical protein